MSKKEMEKVPMRNRSIKKLTAAQMRIASAAPPFDEITGADFKALKRKNNMPTVTGKNGKRVFPYNAVGKAQADSYARMTGGKKKDNPGYGMEKKTKSSMSY